MRITYVRAGSHLLHGRSWDALEVLGAMNVQVHCATAIAEVGIVSLARTFVGSLARAWEAKRTALMKRRDVAREMEGKEKKVLDWLLS